MAGPAGCSKSPVAHYLSWNLGLPIFNHDVIRTEVIEDTLIPGWNSDEYYKRRDERGDQILNSKKNFIYDVSIDRRWLDIKPKLKERGYSWFIISFNLSPELLAKTDKAKGYTASQETVNRWYEEHQRFWEQYQDEVDFVIDDKNFHNRLGLTLKNVKKVLNS